MSLVLKPKEETSLIQLKAALGNHLVPPERVTPPVGVSTGVSAFDQALLWKGFPCGEISLAISPRGQGLISLWLSAVEQTQKQHQSWAAWIQDEAHLYPSAFPRKNLNWNQLVVLDGPSRQEDFFWILQEMITSSIFHTIGCALSAPLLRRHHFVKLKALLAHHHVALVFFSQNKLSWLHALCALVFEAQRGGVIIHRAHHRSVPIFLPEVLQYARPLPQLSHSSIPLLG